MARYLAVLAMVTFVVWRYLPRFRVTWLAVAALFALVVLVRAATAHFS